MTDTDQTKPSALRYVRKRVFAATQQEIAEIGGLSRERVSNMEREGVDPSVEFWRKLREEAKRRELPWSDSFVFDPPCCAEGDACA